MDDVDTETYQKAKVDLSRGFICEVADSILPKTDDKTRKEINALLPEAIKAAAYRGLACCVLAVIDSRYTEESAKEIARNSIKLAVACAGRNPGLTALDVNGVKTVAEREDMPPEIREEAVAMLKFAQREFAYEKSMRGPQVQDNNLQVAPSFEKRPVPAAPAKPTPVPVATTGKPQPNR
jgi:hypothetical protein